MLEVRNIHTYYGDSHILQGLSLEVKQGEVVCLMGRNGAGKTTTIRSIMALTPPRSGEITFQGTRISSLPSYEVARKGIGLTPQGRRVFPTLTVKENLTLAAQEARKNGGKGWTLERVYEIFPRLKERETNRGSQLSGGEQSMLSISRALMLNPELLVMDEPSEGLSPLVVQLIKKTLLALKAEGQSILLVEQNAPLALDVADRVYVISKGQVVKTGTPAELRSDSETLHQLLGV
jgi:branched-chain amino acid transport system ATP-binding protein